MDQITNTGIYRKLRKFYHTKLLNFMTIRDLRCSLVVENMHLKANKIFNKKEKRYV